jgi:hypothetical protein
LIVVGIETVGGRGIPCSCVEVGLGGLAVGEGGFWVLVAAGVKVGADGGSVVAGKTGMIVTELVGFRVGVAGVGEAVSESVGVWVGVFWVGVEVEAPNKPKKLFPTRYPTANMAAHPRMINTRNMGP